MVCIYRNEHEDMRFRLHAWPHPTRIRCRFATYCCTYMRILTDDIRFLRHSRGDGLYGSPNDAIAVSAFQHKCCDPECHGYVSSAWKCGVCDKFSCTHCHEIKGITKEETDAHVCNPDTVETIKLMKADTKPCPGGFSVIK